MYNILALKLLDWIVRSTKIYVSKFPILFLYFGLVIASRNDSLLKRIRIGISVTRLIWSVVKRSFSLHFTLDSRPLHTLQNSLRLLTFDQRLWKFSRQYLHLGLRFEYHLILHFVLFFWFSTALSSLTLQPSIQKMENNQGNLKATGAKKMRKCGIFSVKLSSVILMSLLTLNFWMVPVSAKKGGKFLLDFDMTEVDSEPFYSELEGHESEKEGTVENFDPTPQPSTKNVLTLLKNIQIELAALSNKTTEENLELKTEMADLHNQILDQVNETREDQRQIKDKIEENHDDVKKEFSNLSKELKSQTTSLFNQHPKQEKDEPKPQPTPNPKETTVKVHSDAPKPKPNPTSSPLTAPQFFKFQRFGGSSFTPSSSEWKSKCVNLPLGFISASSLKTGGHCLLICPEEDCKSWGSGFLEIPCHKINVNTKEVGRLSEIGYKSFVKSFRRC